jgi:hypothetical protein
MTGMPKLPRACRRCCCVTAVPSAPGEVPVVAAGLRAPRSIAFFMRLWIERLCSGVEPQALRRRNLQLEAGDVLRQVGFQIRIVERQVIDLDKTISESVGAELSEAPARACD